METITTMHIAPIAQISPVDRAWSGNPAQRSASPVVHVLGAAFGYRMSGAVVAPTTRALADLSALTTRFAGAGPRRWSPLTT